MHVLEIAADELIGLGRPAAALEFAIRALQMEQMRESAHRLVIRAHLAEGNVGEARRNLSAAGCSSERSWVFIRRRSCAL